MKRNMEKMYSFNEIGLIPATKSTVKSRKNDTNPYYTSVERKGIVIMPEDKLPVFVSPMTCILNKENWNKFNNSETIPIYPIWNKESVEDRIRIVNGGWFSVTLQEFAEYFTKETLSRGVCVGFYKVLIDCAQGHMEDLYKYVEKAKFIYGDTLIVMIGNIAEPNAYVECCKSGVDYVRVGIGGGSGCTTSVQTGFHASLPWLLTKINELKFTYRITKGSSTFVKGEEYKWLTKTKVVADGGINSIDKAMKALALGADYVMMGRQFAQCEEACGDREILDTANIEDDEIVYGDRHYYGQSSVKGQFDRFGYVKSNPEGTSILVNVNTDLNKYCNYFKNVLCSAMSYASAHSLEEFIGKVDWEPQTIAEYNDYNK